MDSSERVAEFAECGRAIAAASWQQQFVNLPVKSPLDRAASLCEMADHNLLRTYLLKCGGRPCAYQLGFQLGATCVFYETAYDPQFAPQVPGKVLLFLAIEDLCNRGTPWVRPQRLSFGWGDYAYKAFYGNSVSLETDLVLIRRTPSHRAWLAAYELFRAGLQSAKRLLSKQADYKAPQDGKNVT